jgi:hypothetical protein
MLQTVTHGSVTQGVNVVGFMCVCLHAHVHMQFLTSKSSVDGKHFVLKYIKIKLCKKLKSVLQTVEEEIYWQRNLCKYDICLNCLVYMFPLNQFCVTTESNTPNCCLSYLTS